MNVALLTPRFPWPPDRGDRITAQLLIGALAARGHSVTVLTFEDGTEPPDAREQLLKQVSEVASVRIPRLRSWIQAWLGLVTSDPSQVSYYRSSEMRELARRLLGGGGFDLIFNHTIRMAPFSMHIEHPAKVLGLGDSLGLHLARSLPFEPLWKRPGIQWERRRVDRFEALISRHYRETWALSPPDQEDFIRIGCTNVELVGYLDVDRRLFDLRPEPAAEPRVVYVANFAHPYNIDAAIFSAHEVWPIVRAAVPAARFFLTGANPGPRIRELESIEGIHVTGRVPDILDAWRGADALLAALRFSTGVQIKALEAMAAGVPVVTTPGVAEGLRARHGELLLAGSTARELADGVIATLRDPAAALERAQRAREHVRTNFNMENVVRRLEMLAAGSGSAAAAS